MRDWVSGELEENPLEFGNDEGFWEVWLSEKKELLKVNPLHTSLGQHGIQRISYVAFQRHLSSQGLNI